MSELFNAALEREKNTVGSAIARRRKELRLSLSALRERLAAHGIRLQVAAISKWETGENVPNAYQLLALCRALEIEYVLDAFGREPELDEIGLRKLESYRADLIASGRYRPERPTRGTIRYIGMPVSLLAVSAGTGEFLDEGSFETVSFPEASVPAGAEFGVRVSGDSMEPVYHDGQIVWVRRCDLLRHGEVGIFLYDGSGYMKLYTEREGEDGPQPVLVSYNKKYEPIPVLPERGFRIAGRVLN